MKKQALDALWLRTASKPLWLPPNFLRYLALKNRMDLTELRRKDVRVLGPVYGVPKCKACTDNCCIGKNSRVTLRLSDIAMLMDLQRTDLIDTTPAEKLTDSSAQARFSRSQTFDVFPALKQDERDRCMALDANKRCTLYPHWPLSCARFPYSLDLEAREVFYSPRCPVYDLVEDPNDPRVGQDAGRATVRGRGVPSQEWERVETMVDAALAGYNQRIRDWILITYERAALAELGLTAFLRL